MNACQANSDVMKLQFSTYLQLIHFIQKHVSCCSFYSCPFEFIHYALFVSITECLLDSKAQTKKIGWHREMMIQIPIKSAVRVLGSNSKCKLPHKVVTNI